MFGRPLREKTMYGNDNEIRRLALTFVVSAVIAAVVFGYFIGWLAS